MYFAVGYIHHKIKTWTRLVAVLVREVEVVVVRVTEEKAKGNQVQKRGGAASVEVLGLVPAINQKVLENQGCLTGVDLLLEGACVLTYLMRPTPLLAGGASPRGRAL